MTDLYIVPDHPATRTRRDVPRSEFSRDGEGRWWWRRFEMIAIPVYPFVVAGCVVPWTLLGDLEPITDPAPPSRAIKHPKFKARLPKNHLKELL